MTETILALVIVLLSFGLSQPKAPPPTTDVSYTAECRYRDGHILIKREVESGSGIFHVTDITLKGKTPREAQRQIERAYHWWLDNSGEDTLPWLITEMRKNQVMITTKENVAELESIHINRTCDL